MPATAYAALLITLISLGSVQGEATWFLQLSDLHLTEFNQSQYARFGDRLGDLRLFSQSVLKALAPSAILVTGDLVDGKDVLGHGRQSSLEWQDYTSVIEAFKTDASIPEGNILDIKGNHDNFNVPNRLGAEDYFARLSAAGRRNATSRVYAHHLRRNLNGGGKGLEACPEAVLLGIDVSQEPGLAGVNFFGVARSALLEEVDTVLQTIKADFRLQGCHQVQLVAYGHYPLEIIAHPETDPWWFFGRPKVWVPAHMKTLKGLLLHHGVTAFFSGHLHGAFGQRLHRLHANHESGRYLADLETAAWKVDRRFRIVALDGTAFAFTDLMMHTQSRPLNTPEGQQRPQTHHHGNSSFSITGVDPAQQVNNNIVMIVSPPDARYSPLLASSKAGPQTFDVVRALLLPMQPGASNIGEEVVLKWSCQQGEVTGSVEMAASDDSGISWEAVWPFAEQCKHLLHIQVVVSDGSASGIQPVALILNRNGKSVLGEIRKPLPLGLNWIDWIRAIAINVDWPQWTYRTMNGLWGLHFFGLLLLPKLAVQLGLHIALERFIQPQPKALQHMLLLLLYPIRIFLDLASLPAVWTPQAIYSLYLGFGPWSAAKLLKTERPGLFLLGRILYWKHGQLRFPRCPETSVQSVVPLVFCHLPFLVWLASVAHRVKMQPGMPAWKCVSLSQLILLAGLLCFHVRIADRLSYQPFGIPALLFGPGLSWASIVLLCLLARLLFSMSRAIPTTKAALMGSDSSLDSKSE